MPAMRSIRLSFSGLLLAAIGCGGPAVLMPVHGFVQPLGRNHPLVGRIYDVAQQRFVTPLAVETALARASLVVVGETHDNRDHHALEAQLLHEFGAAHPGARVGFEMLDADQAVALVRPPAPANANELAERVGWASSGWPDFALYRPVFEAAFADRLPIVAAHPNGASVRASLQAVAPEEASALHLDQPLPAAQQAAQQAEIREAHCGHAPAAMVTAMQRAQSYKDAFMAHSILRAGLPALLVSGRGHARKDRGVPVFWQRGGRASLSVALVDVADSVLAPLDYDVGAFDLVVFTPRVSDEDPCQRFREQLERMQHGVAPAQ
jgi:uncharacterized iron-regulated protein